MEKFNKSSYIGKKDCYEKGQEIFETHKTSAIPVCTNMMVDREI